MALRLKDYDVPNRPQRIGLWGPSQMLLLVVALAVFGYASGTWLCVPFIGYILIIEGVFAIREWRWHVYADRVDATFVQIGETAAEIGKQIQAITVAVEARTSEPSMTSKCSVTSDGVRYWAANSKGQN